MACVTLVYRLSSGLLSLPRYFTRPQRGAALSRQQTDSELMHFFAEASDCGFCPPDLPSFELLLEEADQQLFNRKNSNVQHLHRLLPPPSVAS